MAKRIIYSQTARQDRKLILKYWNDTNKSTNYSKKLFQLFKEAVLLILKYPLLVKPTQNENIRIKIVRDYLIVYEIKKE